MSCPLFALSLQTRFGFFSLPRISPKHWIKDLQRFPFFSPKNSSQHFFLLRDSIGGARGEANALSSRLYYWHYTKPDGAIPSFRDCTYIERPILCSSETLIGRFWGFNCRVIGRDLRISVGMQHGKKTERQQQEKCAPRQEEDFFWQLAPISHNEVTRILLQKVIQWDRDGWKGDRQCCKHTWEREWGKEEKRAKEERSEKTWGKKEKKYIKKRRPRRRGEERWSRREKRKKRTWGNLPIQL